MIPATRITDDRFQAWLSQVNEACGHFNGRKLDPGFVGQLEKCQAGQISMSIVDMTQVNLFRGPRKSAPAVPTTTMRCCRWPARRTSNTRVHASNCKLATSR
jgi:hypothetical protein